MFNRLFALENKIIAKIAQIKSVSTNSSSPGVPSEKMCNHAGLISTTIPPPHKIFLLLLYHRHTRKVSILLRNIGMGKLWNLYLCPKLYCPLHHPSGPAKFPRKAIQTQIPQSFHRLIFGFLHPGFFHQVSHGDLPQV